MKKITLQIVLLSFVTTFFACSDKGKTEKEDNKTEENDSENTLSEDEEKEQSTGSSAKFDKLLLQGHWQTENGEGKIQFEDDNVYNPEQETDRTFEIKDKTITYKSTEGSYTNKIIELTDDRFVEETEDGNQTIWVRPANIEEGASIEGEWEIKGGGETLKFENGQVDMGQMGLYSYTIEGDKIIYKNIKDGVDFSQKIVSMTETELVLENDGEIGTYIKQ